MHAINILTALLPLVTTVSASVNGNCNGKSAQGNNYGEYGICMTNSTCNHYHGQYIENGCPDDGNDIKCCLIGIYPNLDTNPCGGSSACQWLDSDGKCPDGLTLVRNDCPGGDNYSCCKA